MTSTLGVSVAAVIIIRGDCLIPEAWLEIFSFFLVGSCPIYVTRLLGSRSQNLWGNSSIMLP